MPKKGKQKGKAKRTPVPITKHTSHHTLTELDISEVDRTKKTTPEDIEYFLILPKAVWIERGESSKSKQFTVNEDDWKEYIDGLIDISIEELIYGPEANRITLKSIQAAFCDAADDVLVSRKKSSRSKQITINEDDWKTYITDLIDISIEELICGPEANRIALESIQAAFCDAANDVLVSRKKKKNILRRGVERLFSCFRH